MIPLYNDAIIMVAFYLMAGRVRDGSPKGGDALAAPCRFTTARPRSCARGRPMKFVEAPLWNAFPPNSVQSRNRLLEKATSRRTATLPAIYQEGLRRRLAEGKPMKGGRGLTKEGLRRKLTKVGLQKGDKVAR